MPSSAGDVLVIVIAGLLLATALGMTALFLLSGRAALRKRRATAGRLRRDRESDAGAWASARGWQHRERDDALSSALPFDALNRALWHRSREVVQGSYRGARATSWVLEYSHRSEAPRSLSLSTGTWWLSSSTTCCHASTSKRSTARRTGSWAPWRASGD